MTNPLVRITRFTRANKTAKAHTCIDLSVYGEGDIPTLEDGMDGLIEMQREAGQPRLWSACRYTERHNKDSFEEATAIILEWDAKSEPELRAALIDLGFAHYIIQTENAASNRLAVMFPLKEEIDDATTYSRVASMLVGLLKVYRLSDGCWAVTFLTQPRAFGTVEFHNGQFVDPAWMLSRYANMFVVAADYVKEPPGSLRRSAPSSTEEPQPSSSRKAAQLDQPNDLFVGLFPILLD